MYSDTSLLAGDPLLDVEILSLLRCLRCRVGSLISSRGMLRCITCPASYAITPPGIPRLLTDEVQGRNAIHEERWNGMPQADYDQICSGNSPVWDAIDRVVLPYCCGTVLEVCCGNGRFLNVLKQHSTVKRVVGLDISIGMLSAAWDRGHRLLIHGSADDLPIRTSTVDTIASSGSGLSFLPREQTYAEIARILKPKGFFVFDLLNYWPSVVDSAWWHWRSHQRLPLREVLQEYKLAGNMKDARSEVEALRRAGLRLVGMKSVQYIPFFRRCRKKLGYWPGLWGSRIGYDTIFVCQKASSRASPATRA